MSGLTLPDGQEINKGDLVTLGCSCHPGASGRITGFRNGLAEIELDDGDDVCLPVHMLDKALVR